jgi:UDP-2,3-diacylglucosamine pyrophosphatase LpxH
MRRVLRPNVTRPRRLPALFLSDLHLGTKGSQAELALDVLSRHEADVYYLVGDIIDGWRLSEGWRWREAHSAVVRHLLDRARAGARVVYIPGNHDEFLRRFVGRTFEGVEIVEDAVHEARDGRRYLIAHGDTFDVVIQRSKALAVLGDRGYRLALAINTALNAVTLRLGLPYWSFSAWIKLKIKAAVNAIGDFERQLAAEARRRGVDGVVCGHIHHPTVRDIDGVTYINIGDFVESCSLVIEREDGALIPLRWARERRAEPAPVGFEVEAESAG